MLLGIIPENVEKASQDLLRYMQTAAGTQFASIWKTEVYPTKEACIYKLAE